MSHPAGFSRTGRPRGGPARNGPEGSHCDRISHRSGFSRAGRPRPQWTRRNRIAPESAIRQDFRGPGDPEFRLRDPRPLCARSLPSLHSGLDPVRGPRGIDQPRSAKAQTALEVGHGCPSLPYGVSPADRMQPLVERSGTRGPGPQWPGGIPLRPNQPSVRIFAGRATRPAMAPTDP